MTEDIQEQDVDLKDTESTEGDDFEIEVEDDTPEEDRGRPRRAEDEEPDVPENDEDLKDYSDSVKKRINKLRYEFHEERRQKEEAARLREQAIEYAKKLHEENMRLKRTLDDGEGMLVGQAKERIAAQMSQAKLDYKNAYEAGDADKLVEAQEKISRLQAEAMRVESYTPPKRAEQPAQEFQPQQPQRPTIPEPDKQAQEWAEKNPWFMKDRAMTGYAMGMHEELVLAGVDPKSKEYYNKIDAAMREAFPNKFSDAASGKRAQGRGAGTVVAPATRGGAKTTPKVVLSSTEVALAKRLGVPLKEYAAQKLKEMNNG